MFCTPRQAFTPYRPCFRKYHSASGVPLSRALLRRAEHRAGGRIGEDPEDGDAVVVGLGDRPAGPQEVPLVLDGVVHGPLPAVVELPSPDVAVTRAAEAQPAWTVSVRGGAAEDSGTSPASRG
ncbi:hypothetical protein M878_43615 [Streptomyces roseochromogenus subsp. oscitans DS 12.976]|uniref:Uncharacterized protein n=1 Tax=Streptomyces roseochromogenus subsp. oscitans DS 12.976 TaxID=1352936 RepID=V6JI49_STRRC|nr:hypothetical protein M878_43615 [Streptomyces roseochromogenus subsp. oscitans DS 12.976]